MLVSGLWKLTAMVGVIGVGLVAAYQAQQGLDKSADPSVVVEERDESPDESGSPTPLEGGASTTEAPKDESPFGENPFETKTPGETKPSKSRVTAPVSSSSRPDSGSGNQATQPNLMAPAESTETESDPFLTETPARPVEATRSGPGVDFRTDPAETDPAEEVKQGNNGPELVPVKEESIPGEGKPSKKVQQAGHQESPKQLPDELDELESLLQKATDKAAEKAAEKLESTENADPKKKSTKPAAKPIPIKPYVRQAREESEKPGEVKSASATQERSASGDTTEADPFSELSAPDANAPKPDANAPKKVESPAEADPFADFPLATPPQKPARELPTEVPATSGKPAKPQKSSAKMTEADSEADPFADFPAKPAPVKKAADLGAPEPLTPKPADKKPLPEKQVPEKRRDVVPVDGPGNGPGGDFSTVPGAVPGSTEPDLNGSKDLEESPKRRTLPKLPTEIPDPLDEPSFKDDFPNEPPARNPAPERRPAPPNNLIPDRNSVPLRGPADQPSTIDSDLIGDGTITNTSPRGVQQPRLTIEKVAPQQANIGEPMVYSIIIKNVGGVDAQQVVVEDRIPKGTQMTGSLPRADIFEKRLMWKLGTLKPNEEKKISIRLIPLQEGSIGSVARVSFSTEAAAEIRVAAPQLAFNVKAPRQVRMGETIELTFLLKNTGSAAATNVAVRDLVPVGLKHEAASDIECPVGKLGPNETREIVLTVTAVKPGRTINRAILTGDGGINQELESPIDVIGEQLVLTRAGQTKIYVDRPAQFTNSIRNDGNAEVKQVRITEAIPAGMEFVEASEGGRFDPSQRAIIWSLGMLPPGAEATVSSKLVARTAGSLSGQVTAVGPAGSTATVKSEVDVIGRPELQIETVSRTGAVAVGDRLTSKIQLKNHGSASARNVSLSIRLPRELRLIEVRGGQYSLRDNVISFEPVAAISPKEAAGFELVMEAVAEADAQMNLEISADHLNKPARRSETVQIAAEIR